MAEITVVEFEDYETLPTHKLHVHLLAGAAAGMMEHCIMYPFDSVKTRQQSLCPCPEKACRTPVGSLFKIIKADGIFAPWRGVMAIAGGSIPAHALYFTVYEKLKNFLTGGQPGHHPIAYGMAGFAATVAHDAVMNPAEVVKQRMQMTLSPYQSCLQCARCTLKGEGFFAFYRSYTTQLMMNVPFQTVHFITYEYMQHWFNAKREYNPLAHVAGGAIAGGVAAAVTTPLDVVKTVLNTQQNPDKMAISTLKGKPDRILNTASTVFQTLHSREHMSGALREPPKRAHGNNAGAAVVSFRGIIDAATSIYRFRGVAGFSSGMAARVLYQMPSTGLAWTVYEFCKYWLSRKDDAQGQS